MPARHRDDRSLARSRSETVAVLRPRSSRWPDGSTALRFQHGGTAGRQQGLCPYVGDSNPIAAMASDLHIAYETAVSAYDSANPTKSHVSVALAVDSRVSAIEQGLAQQDPFLVSEPAGQVDLWDSDPLLACCTVAIRYHPSDYGDYLDALVLCQ